MPLLASVEISQGADNSTFRITDKSNYGGDDPKSNIVSRQLILYKSDGSVYRQPNQLEDEIDFSLSGYPTDYIDIQGVEKDVAIRATMILTPSVAQAGSAYSVQAAFALVGFTMTAFYERQKKQALQPRYEKNTQFITDNHRLICEAENATAAAAADDLAGAQLSLDRAYKIIQANKIPY